jgi:3-phosphoshikimate 1-carboxyvinyltransferase
MKDRVARVHGRGLDGLIAPRRTLDAGNSGTTIRLLTGVLAGQSFTSKITGDSSLRKRPMRRILEPLAAMGANITAQDSGTAPLEILGRTLRGISYVPPIPSAQVKSAVLLAGLFADGETSVEETVATRDHLEIALREFGANVSKINRVTRITPRPRLQGRALAVPGDLSSAVFFIGAALIMPGSQVVIHNVGLNPTRSRILDVLISMGAPIHIASLQLRDGELVGDLSIQHAALAGGEISGAQVAELIDELPMLAALGPYTQQGIVIHDAKELRVKESDRIAAEVEEFADGLRVGGRSVGRLRGAKIDPRGDHRIAMAMSIAALGADADSTILDADCVAISFPEFFPTLDRLVER